MCSRMLPKLTYGVVGVLVTLRVVNVVGFCPSSCIKRRGLLVIFTNWDQVEYNSHPLQLSPAFTKDFTGYSDTVFSRTNTRHVLDKV